MGAGVIRVAMGGGWWWVRGDGRWPVIDGGAWCSACDAKVRQLSARTKFGRAAACYFLLKSEGLRVNSS